MQICMRGGGMCAAAAGFWVVKVSTESEKSKQLWLATRLVSAGWRKARAQLRAATRPRKPRRSVVVEKRKDDAREEGRNREKERERREGGGWRVEEDSR